MDDRRVEYSNKLLSGESVNYRFVTYSHSIRELTLGLVSQYLAEKHLNHLRSAVFTFLTEVINNAVKANLKRVYREGKPGTSFNEEAVANIESYVHSLKDESLMVQLQMQQSEKGLTISVLNNTGINEDELDRISRRLKHAASFNSMEQAMEDFIDISEGGGLGLILTITLLKKSGIDPDCFKLESNQKITRATLFVPAVLTLPEQLQEIEGKIVKQIEYIPAFPETIKRVLDLCDRKESSMSQIAMQIEKDPALTADVLKLVNSAAFSSGNRVKNLSAALPRLGLQNIKQVTLASASMASLNSHYHVFQDFWEHSFKCGFYAKKIAEILELKVELEMVYLGGLLHDLGKIILESVDPETMEFISHSPLDRNRTTSATMEEVTLGVSHAHIGAIVAENWGFSPELVEMIRNHHRPFVSPQNVRLETAVVHLANALLNTEESRSSYIYIDPDALKRLSIGSMEKLAELHTRIKEEYRLNSELQTTP